MTGLWTHADKLTEKCSCSNYWKSKHHLLHPPGSSKVLPHMETHKTALPLWAPLDSEKSEARMQSMPTGHIWHCSSARPWSRKLLSSAPKWWLRCEEMRLTLGGCGSHSGFILHSNSYLLEKFHGHSFCGPQWIISVTKATIVSEIQS